MDTATGSQKLVASGGYLSAPAGIGLEQNGDLLVTDRGTRSLVEINPTTGQQFLVSSGQYFADPFTVAIGSNGHIYVADAGPFGGPAGKIIEVNRGSGAQTLITTGGYFEGVRGVAVEGNGDILVADTGYRAGGAIPDGKIIRVNASTGFQSLVSSGGLLRDPDNLTIASNGDILVADVNAFGNSSNAGAVLRVNPITGTQTSISSGNNFGGGPRGIALDENGNIFVSNNPPGIVRVDPTTGMQTVTSEYGLFQSPQGIAYVSPAPEPSGLVLSTIGIAGIFCYVLRQRRIITGSIAG